MRKSEERAEPKASYDRIVMLVLESVHRDYMHYYNENIPAEATPYLDSLLEKYPHLDHYYSSAVPTTQGLNATFRSHRTLTTTILRQCLQRRGLTPPSART